jgi:translation elongation factor EF-G
MKNHFVLGFQITKRPIRRTTIHILEFILEVFLSGTYIYNSTTGEKERLGRIVRMHANDREEVETVFAGEIAAAVGLKNAKTSHTLCDESNP